MDIVNKLVFSPKIYKNDPEKTLANLIKELEDIIDQLQAGINVNTESQGDYVSKSTYTAQSIVTAVTASTPVAVAVDTNQLVGRTSGNITSLTKAQVQSLLDISGVNTGDQDLSGYALANVSINDQTDSYTLVLADANKVIDVNKATPITVTVPKNSSVAFSIGTIIAIRQKGAGVITISPVDTDVILNCQSDDLITTGQYAMSVLLKIGTNTWEVVGLGDQSLDTLEEDLDTLEDLVSYGSSIIYWQIPSGTDITVAARSQYSVHNYLDLAGSITLGAGAELIVFV